MSDSAVLAHLTISQTYRYFQVGFKERPIPVHEAGVFSVNLHLIPVDPNVSRAIERVRPASPCTWKAFWSMYVAGMFGT